MLHQNIGDSNMAMIYLADGAPLMVALLLGGAEAFTPALFLSVKAGVNHLLGISLCSVSL